MRRKYKDRLSIISTMSPQEYRASEARKSILSEMIKDGEQAKTIKEFADELLSDSKDEALAALANPNSNLKEVQVLYRAALAFNQRVNETIALGETKRQRLNDLKEEK